MTELYYLHKITPLMHLYHSLLVVLDSQLHKLEEFSPFLQTLLLSCLRILNYHLNKDKKILIQSVLSLLTLNAI